MTRQEMPTFEILDISLIIFAMFQKGVLRARNNRNEELSDQLEHPLQNKIDDEVLEFPCLCNCATATSVAWIEFRG